MDLDVVCGEIDRGLLYWRPDCSMLLVPFMRQCNLSDYKVVDPPPERQILVRLYEQPIK